MSTTCICMDTQNGKFLNTSHTQDFYIFGRVINNDKDDKTNGKIQGARLYKRDKKWQNYTKKKCKTGLNFIKCQNSVDNNKVIKKVNYTTLWNPKVFELLTILVENDVIAAF